MIRPYSTKSNRGFIAAAFFMLVGLFAFSPKLTADEPASDEAVKKQAAAAMQTWLTEIDAGNYAKSWTDSAEFFQKAITSDKWVAALTSVRTPLGKINSRNIASALLQTVPTGGIGPAGTYVIVQFNTSFENLKTARETVTFQKEGDGVWRAVGYYIKPQ